MIQRGNQLGREAAYGYDEELSKDTLQYSLQDIDLASNRKG